MPYLALYVIEVAKYMTKYDSSFGRIAAIYQTSIIQKSRHRIKIFDSEHDFTDHLAWIDKAMHNRMNGRHVGLLSRLKKWIQKDLGVFSYRHVPFASTHTALFNLGFDADNLTINEHGEFIGIEEQLKTASCETSKFISTIEDAFSEQGFENQEPFFQSIYLPSEMSHSDYNNKDFLASIFNGAKLTELNSALLLLYYTIRFLTSVFSDLNPRDSESWLRARFITLYQIIASLKILQGRYYSHPHLSNDSKQFFADCANITGKKSPFTNSNFRNCIVHYSLDSVPESAINYSLPYCGVVEYFLSGIKFSELSILTRDSLQNLQNVLDAWIKAPKT